MRILQVCPKYFPFVGGVEIHVMNIAERLARRHEVTVFTTDPSGALPEREEKGGVIIRRFRSWSPADAYHLAPGLLAALRRGRFEIVHAHDYHAFPFLFARNANCEKLVVTPHYHRHGVTPFRNFLVRLYRPMGGSVVRRADSIVTVSDYERAIVVDDFRLKDDRVTVIPNGVDLKSFRALKREARDHKTILCVARLEEFKGVQHAVRVLPLLEPSARLVVVGQGSYKGRLQKLASDLGVAGRTEFYENLGPEDMLRRYAGADVFVHLSRYETACIAVAEALAAMLPCIVTNIPALKVWVDNRSCFGIDDPADLEHLAGLINQLAGREIEEVPLWDWDDVADRIEDVYLDGRASHAAPTGKLT